MNILVDYNNIQQHERQRGVVYIVDRISNTIGLDGLAGASRLTFRLYGGWYEQQMLTHNAQRMAEDILRNYPSATVLQESGTLSKVLTNVELAYSLRVDPSCHLWHTYRPKGMPRGLECLDPVSVGCTASSCPLKAMQFFFANQKCPDPSCTLTPRDLIRRKEQKLVDTMLAADIFYNVQTRATRIAVVSSDDDMWPPIKTALHFGVEVLHVHTKPGHSTSPLYTPDIAAGYIQLNL